MLGAPGVVVFRTSWSVTVIWSLGPVTPLEASKQVSTGGETPAALRKQLVPTTVLVVMSLIDPAKMWLRSVPAGKVIATVLPAAPDIPPVPDALNPAV